MTENDIQKITNWLQESDYILIAAGAGMSASAGLDYTDYNLFKNMFPAMWKVGFRCMYHFIGYHDNYCPDGITPWSDELKWGYLSDQIIHARFEWPNHPIYQNVLEIIKTKDESKTFVISTNADGMFIQNGFSPERIYNPQGDYSNLQCLRQCKPNAFWPSEPVLRNILATVDKTTQKCSSDVIPKCPHCQGPVFLNVRGGNWFIEDVFNRKQAFTTWLQSTKRSKLVILEIGVGFNTPSVLRWPMESLTYSNPLSHLVRINMEHAEVPDEIVDRSISINEDATNAINRISELYLQTL